MHRFEVFYWHECNDEVDFVLRKKLPVIAIEVKSNAEKIRQGRIHLKKLFKLQTALIVGDGGICAEEFLSMDIKRLF